MFHVHFLGGQSQHFYGCDRVPGETEAGLVYLLRLETAGAVSRRPCFAHRWHILEVCWAELPAFGDPGRRAREAAASRARCLLLSCE